MSNVKEVCFYFDLVCPFAYCASTQIDKIASKYNVSVNWIPVLLGGVYIETDAPQGKKSGTSIYSPQKRVWSWIDLMWRCSRFGIELNKPSNWPSRTILPMRLLVSIKDDKLRSKCAKLLYYHYWVKNDNLNDLQVLLSIVKTIGINDISNINSNSIKLLLKSQTSSAVSRGIFGVPTFFIGDDHYFGVDRLIFIDHKLAHNNKIIYPPSMRLYNEECYTSKTNSIEFFFDFSSPWAFLGYLRLNELKGFCNNIIFRPILLGALFRSIGTVNAPALAVSSTKRRYGNKDINRWYNSISQKLKFSSHFPIRSVLPLRVFILDNRTIDCIYKSAWQHDLNIGDPNVLCNILDRNGFNGKLLIKQASNKKVKQLLKDNTSFAMSKGMFGVPTYVVNGDYSRFVWGQDRLDYVKDICCGWKPIPMNTKDKNSKL